MLWEPLGNARISFRRLSLKACEKLSWGWLLQWSGWQLFRWADCSVKLRQTEVAVTGSLVHRIKAWGKEHSSASFLVIARVGAATTGLRSEQWEERDAHGHSYCLAGPFLLPLKQEQPWGFLSVLSLPTGPSGLKGQLLAEHDTACECPYWHIPWHNIHLHWIWSWIRGDMSGQVQGSNVLKCGTCDYSTVIFKKHIWFLKFGYYIKSLIKIKIKIPWSAI